MGGASRCEGELEIKNQGEWRPLTEDYWTLKEAAVVCRELDCGSAVSIETKEFMYRNTWSIESDCSSHISALKDCLTSSYSHYTLFITCLGKPIYDIVRC